MEAGFLKTPEPMTVPTTMAMAAVGPRTRGRRRSRDGDSLTGATWGEGAGRGKGYGISPRARLACVSWSATRSVALSFFLVLMRAACGTLHVTDAAGVSI